MPTPLRSYQVARRLPAPILAPTFSLPTRRDLDGRLLGGAALFGVGWAAAGLCPGPALANLSLPLFGVGIARTVGTFCAAMGAAMTAVDVLEAWRSGTGARTGSSARTGVKRR